MAWLGAAGRGMARHGSHLKQIALLPKSANFPLIAAEFRQFRDWYVSDQAGCTEPYHYEPSPELEREIALLCARPARRSAR